MQTAAKRGRICNPPYVVAFLASPKTVAINGDVIAASGGAPRAIDY